MVISHDKKLYSQTSASYVLPFLVTKNREVLTQPAENIPVIFWPDGRYCFEANLFMLNLFSKGLSRRNNGGSLLTYAANITHVIRFCFFNNIDFFSLTDSHFSFFVKSLQGERRVKSPDVSVRDANSVLAIGRKTLEFLAYIGCLFCYESFIGQSGQIRAEQKSYLIFSKNKKKAIQINYWWHRSFPTPDPKINRLPISTRNMERIRQVILPSSSTIFLRKRRYVMLKLLEITGGRRSEVVEVTIEDIRSASKMADPMLRLVTVKGGNIRYIPLARHDIVFFEEFIEKNRRWLISHTCGSENDCRHLLVSETTGHKLQPNTITQEIHFLAREADIKDKVCPQMFRHRYITKLFVALIEQHSLSNQDEFRKALLDSEKLKQKVQQWTGHKKLDSLNPYIHLAFEEVTGFTKTYNAINLKIVIDSFRVNVNTIKIELNGGLQPNDAINRLLSLLEAVDLDFEHAMT